MRRREITGMIFATGATSALIASSAQAQSCTAPCYPRTQAEIDAGVTPENYSERPGTFERYRAAGDPDDTDAFIRAFSVGGYIEGTPGRTYQLDGAAYLATSDTIVDLRGCSIEQGASGTPFLYIGRTSGNAAFVKTDRVKIIGGNITGAVAGGGSAAYGITVLGPTTNPYVNGGGCDDIELSGVTISGFTGGFVGSGASNIKIHRCNLGGMVYHSALGAGGYGVVFQACFDVIVEGNRFKAGSTDRHAIYVSADPGRTYNNDNVCKNVVIAGNIIDWRGTAGVTTFEGAIEIRSAERATVTGNVIDGAWGGIEYDAENANGFGVTITGNVVRGIRAGASQRNAISVARSSGTYITRDIVIAGNSIEYNNTNVNGIVVDHCTNAAVEGNTINVGNGIDAIIVVSSTSVRVGANVVRVSGSASSHVAFAGTCSDITVGRGTHSGTVGSEYRYYSNPTNIRFDFPRTAVVTWSSGTATVADSDNIVSSQASSSFGFTLTFESWVTSLDAANLTFTSAASNVCSIYRRIAAGQVLTVGVKDFAGVELPAASNDYSIAITLKS